MNIKIPIDIFIIFGPVFSYFIISLIIFDGTPSRYGSERDLSGIFFYPVSLMIGFFLWGFCLKVGWI